ncbi:polysaccharide lyase beta-sandwich domain-containing protein [Flavonifractor hominis]|uniref:Polysaccharide lyase beta-sandwich domain-containing protein n=1 Tax=Flavonifractor hominis TaxID=3133178 RepID=A0ABV1EME5_9FIRM
MENYKAELDLSNTVTVDGKVQNCGETDEFNGKHEDVHYIYMEGNVEGADVGYVFPGGADVTGLRETRTQKWTLMNTYDKFYYDDDVTNSFITMYLEHGANPVDASYQYIILPSKSEAETADYSTNADVEILANTDTVHAVREKTLGITAVNFFEAGDCPEAQVSVDKLASVMFGTDESGCLTVSVADVTNKAEGTITVTLSFTVDRIPSGNVLLRWSIKRIALC